MMPIRGRKFVTDFLIPNLNGKKFGTRLMWLNVKYSIFQVQWNHKSASDWTSYDAEVFMEWDKIKGRCQLGDKECYTKSKQRFRAIMYKLIKARHITELSCNDKYTKVYCLGSGQNIPREIVTEAISSRGSRICVFSFEGIYKCDSEKVMDLSDISSEIYIAENLTHSVNEDHKYANLMEEGTEKEDIVPDNQLEYTASCDSSDLYFEIIAESIPEKHRNNPKLEDCFLESFDGSNSEDETVSFSSNDIKWKDKFLENICYDELATELFQSE